MATIEIGTTVIRQRAAEFGEEGQVVEIKDSRARVYWPLRKRRTWIRFQDIKAKSLT